MKKTIATVLAAVMILSLACAAYASGEPAGVQEQGGWYYTVSGGEATIVAAGDSVKTAAVILFPGTLGGYPVTAIGANGTAVVTNASGWVLIPEGVRRVEPGAFYDLNRTPGWSFPSTLQSLPESALASCGGTFYAAVSPVAQAMGAATGHTVDTAPMTTVTVAGSVYNVPAPLAGTDLSAYAATGASAQTAAPSGEASAEASAVAQPSDSIVTGAVAAGAQLPADVFTPVEDVSGEGSNRYMATMGVETGTYYAVGGVLYQMVYITQNVRYATKAQIINDMYASHGLVYGRDYDLIRLFNYVHSYQNGPRPGDFHIYTCYLYKSVGSQLSGAASNLDWERAYEHTVDGVDQPIQGDVATLMVQSGGPVYIQGLHSQNNTIAYGPSEAANFYGLGSAVLVDGGNTTDYRINSYDEIDFGRDDSCLILADPTIVGTENVLYAVAGGTAYVTGGRYFGSSSGGHGFYAGMGGKISLNGLDYLDTTGKPITDPEVLKTKVMTRPGLDLGYAVRTDLTQDWNAYAAPVFPAEGAVDEDVAILVTADETGTALTTDTGGGVIVANRLSATTYGRGCAGVYSIGGDESYVFVYNSSLHSRMDAGLVSASNGYIFAFNCDLEGVAGIKTRSGGSGTWIGVDAYNSRVISSFDPSAYGFYDLGSDQDSWEEDAAQYENWTWADDKSFVNAPMLNMFVNKTNAKWGADLTTVQNYWFRDKTTAPQTGEVMACVILTGTAPVSTHSCLFVNENYQNYAAQGATNYLVAGDNGGSGTINFYDQNSRTKWDLTGVSPETTELTGDIYVAEIVTMSGPDAGSGPATVNANFYDSEWTGKTVNWMQNANLTFDAASRWTVTDSCGVGQLAVASLDQITAEKPVTVTVYYGLTVNGQTVTQPFTYGNVTYTFAEPLEATPSGNTASGAMSGEMGSGEPS